MFDLYGKLEAAYESMLLHIFLWVGQRQFGFISVYCPDKDDPDPKVLAVHFAIDEATFERSIKDALVDE